MRLSIWRSTSRRGIILAAFFMPSTALKPAGPLHPAHAEPRARPRLSDERARIRRLGQIFTPRPVADWMAAWACSDHPRNMLEPAAGDGVFLRALESVLAGRQNGSAVRVTAFEVDAGLAESRPFRSGALQVHLRREDFIAASLATRFDAAVANPPYVRHHALRRSEAIMRRFDRLCGRRLSRMTNLYGLFVLKIWSLLAARGRAAIITPAEWLNADFGVPIKAYLLEQNGLDGIIHFDHAERVFSDALTTAAIILLRHGRNGGDPVRLSRVSRVADLRHLEFSSMQAVSSETLHPAEKWSPLFDRRQPVRRTGHSLRNVAACSRGIATGANSYFVLRESERLRWKINRRDVRLCISKARQIRANCLTAGDMRRLIAADEPVWLLAPRRRLSAPVQRYLAEGRRLGIDRRYLPSHRPVWFRPESRAPAHILVAVFARGVFRFVLNEARVLNLTAYHGVYPRTEAVNVPALHAYLCSPSAQKALKRHRRIYGGGLSKLEPRDVEAIEIPEDLCPERK